MGDSINITIYTANFGGYDTVKPVTVKGKFFYFTDQDITIDGWRVKKITPALDSRREARYWKINSHLVDKDADYTIWVDASFHIIGDLKELVKGVETVACYKHGTIYLSNNCIYDEAEVCAGSKLDNPAVIRKQVERYKNEDFPEKMGLFSTGIIVRKNTPRVRHFNEAWWYEVDHGSYRDQLSQMYASWRTGVNIQEIKEGNVYQNGFVTRTNHINNKKT